LLQFFAHTTISHSPAVVFVSTSRAGYCPSPAIASFPRTWPVFLLCFPPVRHVSMSSRLLLPLPSNLPCFDIFLYCGRCLFSRHFFPRAQKIPDFFFVPRTQKLMLRRHRPLFTTRLVIFFVSFSSFGIRFSRRHVSSPSSFDHVLGTTALTLSLLRGFFPRGRYTYWLSAVLRLRQTMSRPGSLTVLPALGSSRSFPPTYWRQGLFGALSRSHRVFISFHDA